MEQQLISYLEKHIANRADWVIDLEKVAKEDKVPIMDSVSINYLLNLIKIHQPKKILEIGTAIGYSALRMNDANPNAHITTIEKDEQRYKEAVNNIEQRNKSNEITVYCGDALEVIKNKLNEMQSFDFIFIDAAKGKNKEFFDLVHPLLTIGGTLVVDNILFRGFVATPELAPKRYKNMVKKIIEFNAFLSSHPSYITSILPVGDGVMVCHKVE